MRLEKNIHKHEQPSTLGDWLWPGARKMDDLQLNSKSERALDSLTQTVRIFSKDTGIQFGIDKWAMLVMKKGKIVKSDGIQLPNDKVLKSLEVFRCARSR